MCDKRGGAMKPSLLRADTDLFETLNPGFHTYLKSYANPEFMKNAGKVKYLSIKDQKLPKKNNQEQEEGDDEEEPDEEFTENLYYDIQFLNDKFTGKENQEKLLTFKIEEELINEPKPVYIWAHLTCGLFIPELFFTDQTFMTNITGKKSLIKYFCLSIFQRI